jgi:hypothetical protein
LGVGFLVGYGVAALVKGDGEDDYTSSYDRYYAEEQKSYAAQPVMRAGAADVNLKQGNGKHDEGPGFFEKLTSTTAYHKVKQEAGNLGDAVVQEISKTAKTVVLPALMTSLRNFIGDYLPKSGTGTDTTQSSGSSSMRPESDRPHSGSTSGYQPALERNQG